MTRNLKVLGLALVAMFAMSVIAASAAQAVEGTFSWDSGTTTLKGTQDDENGTNKATGSQVFTILAGAVSFTCDEVHAESTVAGTGNSTIETKSITYTDSALEAEGKKDTCTGTFGTRPVIKMNECNYRFHAGTTVGEKSAGTTEGTVDIVCPGTNVIEVAAAGCLTKVPAQNGLGPVYFHTEATNPETVTIEAKVGDEPEKLHNHGIKYSTSGFLCGTHTNEENGTYTGNVTVKGFNASNAQTNVTVT